MNLLEELVPSIIGWAFYIFQILLIIYILMSWVPQAKDSPIGIGIGKIVEPYLSIFRRFIPPIAMIDFSPIVAIIAIRFVQQGVFAIWIWIVSLL
ncbi:YggT family protein [Shimazuella kribbensis]|uniref:YggT family protein n=1 Tax=Shimazuella kribbensis TaxID=139808 RepID=UPI00040E0B5B|nr:YggT family protein [Shimazuella kribbensis]